MFVQYLRVFVQSVETINVITRNSDGLLLISISNICTKVCFGEISNCLPPPIAKLFVNFCFYITTLLHITDIRTHFIVICITTLYYLRQGLQNEISKDFVETVCN